ncbi:MAG TPA: ribosome biogenesis GTPase Der [Ghiorsea sp.]|nr:ribosome biogenesis GTPase Der [Ghiorsea sp.]HIP06627.1 ribosome biogenesis GTPase Der [Mariprofundaceae bacterium]
MAFKLSVVAIVGRPNVGKSTLFNRIIKKRKAIVGDRPGVTVDRLETECVIGGEPCVLVDTGGIGENQHGEMQGAIDGQVEAALEVADIVLFAVDALAGPTPVDHALAQKLRKSNIATLLIVNKAENAGLASEFFVLGMGDPQPVSAAHGHGMQNLCTLIAKTIPKYDIQDEISDEKPLARVTVIGRPNVGKSTLINAWLGKDRMVVSPIAGTTRDAIDTDMPYEDSFIRLVDTAGQRKSGRISDVIEFVARVKAVQAFRRADVAVMVLDGGEGIVEQDMRLMHLAQEEGCALVVAVNKVDLLSDEDWRYYVDRLDYRMRGLPDIPVFRTAAKHKKGIKKLLKQAVEAGIANGTDIGTGELNRWMIGAEKKQYAPSDGGSVVRLKYVSQIGTTPPTIRIFSNRPQAIKSSYKHYLEKSFRQYFKLPGVPVRIKFGKTDNPYEEKMKGKMKTANERRHQEKKRSRG